MGKKIDLTGQRFGRLIVVKEAETLRSKYGTVRHWECLCDCGNVKMLSTSVLRTGRTKSCGCIRKGNFDEHRNKDIKEGTKLSMIKTDKKPYSNNKSGFIGVSWVKKAKKWGAYINFKGKYIYLGYFEDKQDAINARKAAEKKYFKPFLEKYSKEIKEN